MDLKMEIYTPALELAGVLEIYKSVIWEESAFKAGSFSVDSLITAESVALLVPENIIWIEGETAGIVEYVDLTADDSGPYIKIKGPTLTGILGRRILWGRYNLYDTAPAMMRHLVEDCAINPTRGDNVDARKIPGLYLEAWAGDAGPRIRKQQTGGTLLDALTEIGAANDVAFGVRFNARDLRMEFWTRRGVNRSVGQDANEPVFYATDLDDVLESEYQYNSAGWRNVALVGGEGEGDERIYVVVNGDSGDTPPAPPPAPGAYSIVVSVDPAGGGSVSGGGSYADGATVTLSASAATGYVFSGWRENGEVISTSATLSFPATADRSIAAVFAAVRVYTISASVSPDGSGSVSGAGAYSEGATVTLMATAGSGYTFSAWMENGVSVSADAAYTFTATGDRALVAVFAGESRLPAGYTELEYVTLASASKTDIFDTGIHCDFGAVFLEWEITPSAKSDTAVEYYFYAVTKNAGTSSSLNRYCTMNRSSDTANVYRLGADTTSTTKNFSFSGKRTNFSLNLFNRTFDVSYYDSENVLTPAISKKNISSGGSCNSNIFINGQNGTGRGTGGQLYFVNAYSDGEKTGKTREWVPVLRESDSTAGLYDVVGHTFVAIGTAGPEV